MSELAWVHARVVQDYGDVTVRLDDITHRLTKPQATALGSRLLQAGSGSTFAEEEHIRERIDDVLSHLR